MDLLTELTILVLAAFVGFEVISKVPNTLHTPLMSATNAIHGIVLLGGLLLIGEATGFLDELLLVIAIAFGTINVVGGFLVTDRMLEMFKRRGSAPRTAARLMYMASFLQDPDFIRVLYIIAFICFILGLRLLSHPRTARKGNIVAAGGMAVAVIATLLIESVGDYLLIAVGMAIGTAIGAPAARRVKMTAMPQMVALFNGVGGGAVALISFVEYRESLEIFGVNPELETLIPILFAAIIGSVSFWGSNVAFAKLQELIPGRPISLPGQQFINIFLLAVALGCGVAIAAGTESEVLFLVILLAAAVLGNMFVLPIGGADMPVVISLLNALTGLSAAAAGMALDNVALIVAGMLVGASGSILTMQMAEAMNRSIPNIIAGGFGGVTVAASAGADGEQKPVRSTDAADVAIQLAYASRVVVAPGYGMAVAQAQHTVRELADELEKRGIRVDYAIHPVAGRMPGHMNVLLAEADVPYDHLKEMDEINPEFPQTDVALVIGANDVTNPAARDEEGSPDLRDADPRRRQGRPGDRAQALDEYRLRGHRQPALLQREHSAAVRRRQGVGRQGAERGQAALARAGTPGRWRQPACGAGCRPPRPAPARRRP